MQFCILTYESKEEIARRNNPAEAQSYWAAYFAYSQALSEAGVAIGGAGLQPPALATSVRVRDGKRHLQDGPFADTKEQLGGFFNIDVPSLDKALEWAARCPASSTGTVELRPILPPPPAKP